MMRVKATIVVTIKGLISQWKQLIVIYAIFPLLLSLFMGYTQRDVFKPEVNMDKINITIIDEDSSNFSKGFKELFLSEGIKELFNITDKGDYIFTIPKGYEENILSSKDITINIDEKERVSRSNETIIKTVIEEYGKQLTETMMIQNRIGDLPKDYKENSFEEISNKLKEVSKGNSIKNNIVKGEKSLSSFENQGASLMTFMVFSMIMGSIAGYHLDKENGSFKRLMSTPITKATFFNLDLLIFFIYNLICGSIYILTFRITGLAFKDVSLINILAILFSQSILIASIAGIIIAFINKKMSNILIIIFMYFEIIFGGGFIPLKEVTNKIFLVLSDFSPGKVISEAYRSVMVFNSFERIEKYLIIMIITSMVIYVISLIKVKLRWEE